MDSMQYLTAREAVVSDIPIKRLPEDEEFFDMNRAPPKRQAVEDISFDMQDTSSRASSEVAVQGLKDKTPGELVSIILQLQSSYGQQVAHLQSQYAVVSSQLEQLTSILNTHLTSQVTAIKSVQQEIVSISLPQQTLRPSFSTTGPRAENGSIAHVLSQSPSSTQSQPAPAPAPAPPLISGLMATPRPRGGIVTHTLRQTSLETPSDATFSLSQIPTATSPDDSHHKVELKVTPSSVPNQPPTVIPSRLDTVAEVWEEYRYGRNGNPSVDSLEARWGPRWRRDYKVQKWFNRRKIIADRIKQYVADGVDEQVAVRELQRMRETRTLNWLSRKLEDHRKETKKHWKAAQEAAIANKQALLGSASGSVLADLP